MRVNHEEKRIYVRQSWLGDFLLCPQRAKYGMSMPKLRRGSDATAIGTALHASIEECLKDSSLELEHMITNARAFVHIELAKDIKRTDISNDPDKMLRCVDSMATAWWDDIRPYVHTGGLIEHKFTSPLNVNAKNGYEIYLEGTMDYVSPDGSIWDWKTASRAYYAREKQTQSHQATCYSYASRQLGLVPNDVPTPFRFGVMVRQEKPKAQVITTLRDGAQDQWLQRQVKSAIDTSLDSWGNGDWLMNDQHNLCSSKWCDYWNLCKGAHWDAQSMLVPEQAVEVAVDICFPSVDAKVTASESTEQLIGESE